MVCSDTWVSEMQIPMKADGYFLDYELIMILNKAQDAIPFTYLIYLQGGVELSIRHRVPSLQ